MVAAHTILDPPLMKDLAGETTVDDLDSWGASSPAPEDVTSLIRETESGRPTFGTELLRGAE